MSTASTAQLVVFLIRGPRLPTVSNVADFAEHAYRAAIGKRVAIKLHGRRIVGRVLASRPGPNEQRFRLRARRTHYVRLDLAPRLRLLSATPRTAEKARAG